VAHTVNLSSVAKATPPRATARSAAPLPRLRIGDAAREAAALEDGQLDLSLVESPAGLGRGMDLEAPLDGVCLLWGGKASERAPVVCVLRLSSTKQIYLAFG
jgi:hypothetical protein